MIESTTNSLQQIIIKVSGYEIFGNWYCVHEDNLTDYSYFLLRMPHFLPDFWSKIFTRAEGGQAQRPCLLTTGCTNIAVIVHSVNLSINFEQIVNKQSTNASWKQTEKFLCQVLYKVRGMRLLQGLRFHDSFCTFEESETEAESRILTSDCSRVITWAG